MSNAPHSGKKFQLADNCVLLKTDGHNFFPRIIDLGQKTPQYLKLGHTAAFIMRFVLQRVDTNLIRELLKSEYNNVKSDDKADGLLTDFFNNYLKFLATASHNPGPHGNIPPEGQGDHQPVTLDFKVNPIGLSVFKFPLT